MQAASRPCHARPGRKPRRGRTRQWVLLWSHAVRLSVLQQQVVPPVVRQRLLRGRLPGDRPHCPSTARPARAVTGRLRSSPPRGRRRAACSPARRPATPPPEPRRWPAIPSGAPAAAAVPRHPRRPRPALRRSVPLRAGAIRPPRPGQRLFRRRRRWPGRPSRPGRIQRQAAPSRGRPTPPSGCGVPPPTGTVRAPPGPPAAPRRPQRGRAGRRSIR